MSPPALSSGVPLELVAGRLPSGGRGRRPGRAGSANRRLPHVENGGFDPGLTAPVFFRFGRTRARCQSTPSGAVVGYEPQVQLEGSERLQPLFRTLFPKMFHHFLSRRLRYFQLFRRELNLNSQSSSIQNVLRQYFHFSAPDSLQYAYPTNFLFSVSSLFTAVM